MKIDIYQSNSNPSKFMSVAAGTLPSSFNVPDKDYQSVSSLKTNVDTAGNPVALDSAAAQAAIQADGYYLHSASVR